MAERYGWTPEQIDEVDKHRVRKWQAVKDVADMAGKYLHEQGKGTQNAMGSREKWAR